MPQVPGYDLSGAQGAPVTLPDEWFAERVSRGALYQAVRAYEANQRQGTAATLTRGMVSGSTAKPWRQKGTGRARAGTRKSPIWTGGGITFGPHPRDHRQKVPRGLRRLALRSALRQKLDEDALFAVTLDPFDRPRTARLARALGSITDGRAVLLLTAGYDENLHLSGRNIERLTLKQLKDVTAYEVIRASVVLIETAALEGGLGWLASGAGAETE
ncbi:MAG: 50S ribosomal protein L4 [Gemmatimonadetes bacterium]|nr:50S ribosomal protein L4 [Gemmatimonadota bacterium]